MDAIQQGTHQFTFQQQKHNFVSLFQPDNVWEDQISCAVPEYGAKSWGHWTVRETITLAQPP